ncbi:MAG: stage III sporulation protein AF [Clostridiales bacterium]|nr:stage III sporulation protein AF [Clostridiales bacterium]
MEWLAQWVRNLAFYFIFLSAVMNFIPGGEEKKYIRFFMGMLLILVMLQPLLQISGLDGKIEGEVLEDSLGEAFEEMMRETGRQEMTGTDYVKDACGKEVEAQIGQLADHYGYETITCEVTFFDGERLELQGISLKLRPTEEKSQEEGTASAEEQKENIKNELEEVYNIPGGNINIMIQG